MLTIIPQGKCQHIAQTLSMQIDTTKQLPERMFIGGNLNYWFFERPLLGNLDLFEGLLIESFKQFSSGVGILFSWNTPDCIGRLLDGADPEKSVLELDRQVFKNTELAFPDAFFSETHEWLAYESTVEEWGVLAMDRSLENTDFFDFLNREFISIGELWKLSKLDDFNGALARAFLKTHACR